jgi:hypothetical protein
LPAEITNGPGGDTFLFCPVFNSAVFIKKHITILMGNKTNIEKIETVPKSNIGMLSYLIIGAFFIVGIFVFKAIERNIHENLLLLIPYFVTLIVFFALYILMLRYINSNRRCNKCGKKAKKIGKERNFIIYRCPNGHVFKSENVEPGLVHGGVKIKGV